MTHYHEQEVEDQLAAIRDLLRQLAELSTENVRILGEQNKVLTEMVEHLKQTRR